MLPFGYIYAVIVWVFSFIFHILMYRPVVPNSTHDTDHFRTFSTTINHFSILFPLITVYSHYGLKIKQLL